MSTDGASNQPCAMCMNEGSKACSGCHEMRYCSTECQRSDWPVHKAVCKSFKEFSDANRPHQDGWQYRRAIYFPVNENRPRFIWVRFFTDANGIPRFDKSNLPAEAQHLSPMTTISMSQILDRELDHGISILSSFLPVTGGSGVTLGQDNKSLNALFPGHNFRKCGAFVAHGVKSKDCPDQTCDLGPMDFRHMVDEILFQDYYAGRKQPYNDVDAVQGLTLNCIGDSLVIDEFSTQITATKLPRSMCNEPTEVTIEIAERVGIPLVVKKLPPSLIWRDRPNLRKISLRHNAIAALLTALEIDPDSLEDKTVMDICEVNFGHLGSWQVVRKDGQPLTEMLVKGLCLYLRSKFPSVANGEIALPATKEAIYAMASKAEFDIWYSAFAIAHNTGTANGFWSIQRRMRSASLYNTETAARGLRDAG